MEDYYNKDGNKSINQKRSLGTKYGNFLENPFLFDSQLFGISPREAPSIDPQQRLMLQTVYRSLENAGYVPDSTPSFSRETFGCFVGSATLDYVDNLRNSIDVYYSPGTLRAFLSGRISHAFNWSGPSLTVDTACSSSLVAIYQAVRAIIVGDCRAAVAGGVNVVTSPDMYLGLDRAHFLSPTGQCKAFDQSADGYCRSEGCAAYVLKRLDDAVAENDRILGVIKGVDINQSGQSSSITHPHSPTQEKLFERLLSKTRANLQDVSVVEAHGTGTPSGDPSEVRSIRNAFCKSRSPENPLHMTSIKANIGHCEAASGGASLAKLLLMLKHGRMPPQPSLTKLNPAIDPLGEDGAVISSEASDWPAVRGTSRIALLNNFGAAGSNAALLLQEHQAIAQEPPEADSKITWCFGVSARDEATLKQMQQELTDYLTAQRNELSVADVCYTSTARRSLNQFRLSTSAWSIEQLITNLKEAASYEAPSAEPPNVFLFSGQGSQYFGMGRQLMGWLPQFTKTVQDCHQLLVEWGLPSCMDVIQPSETAQLDPQNPTMLQALQSGIYVLEVALSHLLTDLGMQPNMVAGHSLGEYAALVTAGVLDIESGLWLVAHRARLIVASCELWETSMLAVKMAADQVGQKFLSKSRFEQLSISCDNSQNDCVVGGDKRSLQELKDEITSRTNQRAAFLQVPIAYHTAALDPVLEDLKNVADQVSFTAPRIPVASNVLRRVVQPGEDVFTPEYFAEHCRSTVAFNDSMLDVLKYNEELANGRWVEVGPHPTLLPMVKSRTSSTSTQHLSCMTKDQHPSSTLANVFTAVYRNSKNVHWRKLFESTASKPNMINLPTMPFHRKEYYVPLPRENRPAPGSPSQCTLEGTQFSLLDHVVKAAGPQGIAFETSIRTLESLIKGHMVCEKALCPASIYGELALAGISHREGAEAKHQVHKLSELSFSRPLIFLDGHNDIVKTNFGARHGTDEGCPFEISSRSENEEDSQARVHCSGKIKSQSWSKAINKLKVTERALSRRKLTFLGGDRQSFSTNVMYKKIFSRVVEYSSLYQAVHKIYIDEDAAEIFASCELPPSNDHAHYAGNPVLLDTILHVAGFAANLNVENDAVCICHEVHSIRMLRQHIGSQHAFEVHCSNFSEPDDPDSVLADAYAMDDEGIVAVIKGMRFQRAKLSKVKAGFDFATRGRSKVGRQPSPAVKQDVLRPEEHPTHVETDTEQPTNNEDQASTAASIAPSQATLLGILSETTGVNSKDIIPRTELDAIGVDSLMAFELEDKLQKAIEQPVKSSELTEAKTVGDLEKIVTAAASKAGTPISKGSTPPRSVPSGVLRGKPVTA